MKTNTSTIGNLNLARSVSSWKKTSKAGINFIGCVGFILQFGTDKGNFTITYPEKYPKSRDFLVEADAKCDWIKSVHTFIFNTSPDFQELISEIENLYKNTDMVLTDMIMDNELDMNFDDFDPDKLEEEDNMLLQYDLEEVLLRQRLEKAASTAKSPLKIDDNSKKVPMLFNGVGASVCLLNEYMSLWKTKRHSSTIKITLVDDNIYHWRIQMKGFTNEELNNSLQEIMKTDGFDYIEIDLQFHEKLYPMYPPFVRVTKPPLNNSLANRITNTKMVQLDYWNPTRSVDYILTKLFEILDTNAVVDLNSVNTKGLQQAYHPLYEVLMRLTSLCDLKLEFEELDKTEYKKMYNTKFEKSKSSTESNKYSGKTVGWAPGTGYGYSGQSDWDPEQYMRLQKEKDEQILGVLAQIINILTTSSPNQSQLIHQIVKESYLNLFLRNYLQGTTLIDMNAHKDIYRMIFTLLEYFITIDGVYIFADRKENDIFSMITDINNEAITMKKFIKGGDKDDSEIDLATLTKVECIHQIVAPHYSEYIKERDKIEAEAEEKRIAALKEKDKNWAQKMEQSKSTSDPIYIEYAKVMKELSYADQCKFTEHGLCEKGMTISVKGQKSLAKEFGSMGRTLPIHFDSSIFLRVEEKMNYMRVVITGPDATPYDSGVFIFDVACGSSYPDAPPKMLFNNNGHVRQNPNLYDNGKVCLSLLGTWNSNNKNEMWNKNSTLVQLFISVQSQILIGSPFWNEPGHENCPKSQNDAYCQYCQYFTMRHAMIDVLRDVAKGKFGELKSIVLNHFRLKKTYILKIAEQWCNNAKNYDSGPQQSMHLSKQMMQNTYKELTDELEKL
jgi:baculoviral IAP repeat-containing protein 6 (apollon)